ncbi:MAG: amino acid ABC transporter permease [Alphaproteobacteria bacterium]|nr:amino acid ABC transporter permease [Alphaproteobacteria bacterium]
MGAYNWNWPILLKEPYFGWIVSGFGNTCLIAVIAWAIAFPLGSAVGLARTTELPWLRLIGTAYVELFRNIPLLAQMFVWYYVVPELLPNDWSQWVKRDMPYPQFYTAVLCLGLYTASRVAEQVRSGIEAIPRGQRHAGLAMGLTPGQVYRYILLPVGYRTIIPPLTSDFLGVFKNSSLALTIGVLELTSQARQIEEYTFAAFEAFATATVLYCMVTGLVILIMRQVERRTRIAGTIALGAS